MPEKKQRVGSIFQPTVEEFGTSTFVQQGVAETQVFDTPVDKSTASLIKTFGDLGLDAYKGYQGAKVKQEVEGVVGDLFERKLIESESDISVDERFAGAAQQTRMLAEEGFGEEDPAVHEMGASLKRLARAKDIGNIDEFEFKARVQEAVKRGINRLPGQADMFRKIAGNVLGDNSARIDQVFAVEKAQAEAQRAAAKENAKHINRVSTFAGKAPSQLTNADFTNFQMQASAKAQEEQASLVDASALRDTSEKVQFISNIARARSITLMSDMYAQMEQMQVNGRSISQIRAEQGDAAVIDAVASNETALQDWSRNLSRQLDKARLEINSFYSVKAHEAGIKDTDVAPEKKAQLEVLDQMDAMLKSDIDDGQLASLFKVLNLQNKTHIEKTMTGAPILRMMNATGSSSTLLQQYTIDKDSVTRLFPEVKAEMDFVYGGNNPGLAEQVTDNVVQLANGETTLADFTKTSPRSARIAHAEARHHISNMKKTGFVSGNENSINKQKETFVRFSSEILKTISPINPNSVRVLSETFGDARYQKLIKELDGPQREQITSEVNSRYDTVIGNKENRISVLGRAEAAKENFIKEETAAQGGKFIKSAGAPVPKILISNNKLVSNVASNRLASNVIELITGNQRGEYKDHADAVLRLNRLLEDKYRVISTFEDVGSYRDFLTDFYSKNIKE